MGILDQIESLAGGAAQGSGSAQGGVEPGQQSSVAKALMSSLEEHPGGVGGLLDQFKQNGMGGHVDSWLHSESGQAQPQALTPEQVQQGAGSGLVSKVAERSGLPQGVVTMAMTTLLPMVMQHMTPGGQVPAQGEFGGLASGLLSRFL